MRWQMPNLPLGGESGMIRLIRGKRSEARLGLGLGVIYVIQRRDTVLGGTGPRCQPRCPCVRSVLCAVCCAYAFSFCRVCSVVHRALSRAEARVRSAPELHGARFGTGYCALRVAVGPRRGARGVSGNDSDYALRRGPVRREYNLQRTEQNRGKAKPAKEPVRYGGAQVAQGVALRLPPMTSPCTPHASRRRR